MSKEIPSKFLWHKAGSESSLDLTSTFNIKELQRQNNPKGIFLWGLGCTVSPNRLRDLINRTGGKIELVISEIVSRSRPQDITYINQEEKDVRVWHSASSVLDGSPFEFPSGSQVVSTTSNAEGNKARRPFHFALVCQSSSPINHLDEDGLVLDPTKIRMFDTNMAVRNSATLFPVEPGTPKNEPRSKKMHRVFLIVQLVEPYIVKLTNPQFCEKVIISKSTGRYPV